MNVVYAIRNKENLKVYVGSTTQPHRRKIQHFSELRNGRHRNRHLQGAFKKYGEESFEWIILDSVEPDNLLQREKEWILKLSATNPSTGYNATDETLSPMLGKKHSLETINKMKLNMAHGENHHNSRITEDIAKKIFELFEQGLTQSEIEDMLNVDQTNISLILRGKAWKHLKLPFISGRVNNTSGCVGVYYQKPAKKWKSEIINNGVYHNLGIYSNLEDAINARKSAERRLSSDTK